MHIGTRVRIRIVVCLFLAFWFAAPSFLAHAQNYEKAILEVLTTEQAYLRTGKKANPTDFFGSPAVPYYQIAHHAHLFYTTYGNKEALAFLSALQPLLRDPQNQRLIDFERLLYAIPKEQFYAALSTHFDSLEKEYKGCERYEQLYIRQMRCKAVYFVSAGEFALLKKLQAQTQKEGCAEGYAMMRLMEIHRAQELRQYDEAMHISIQLLDYVKDNSLANWIWIAILKVNTDLHQGNGDMASALHDAQQILEFYRAENDSLNMLGELNNMGYYYRELGNSALAIQYTEAAIQLADKLGHEIWQGVTRGNLGTCYLRQQQYQKALPLLLSEYDYVGPTNDFGSGLVSMLRAASCYAYLGEYEQAHETIQKVESIMRARKVTVFGKALIQTTLLETQWQVYEQQGDYANALRYHRAYVQFRDSAQGKQFSDRVKDIQTAYEVEKKEQANLQLEAQNREKEQVIYVQRILVGLILVFFVFSLISSVRLYQVGKKRKKAHEEALRANQAKSDFLANMSHEMRTPLHSILGFSDLLRSTALSPVQQGYVATLQGSANTLVALVDDVLDLSKIEAGKMELSPQKVQLCELLAQITEMIRPKLQGNSEVELILDLPPDLATEYVWADDLRLRQVLVNLLTNATKFTAKGEILVRVTHRAATKNNVEILNKRCFHFSVSDTGIGIAPEKLQQIFDAFTQADASTTRQYGGSGLGLTISNTLLALMGSKLEVESVEGQGSCFSFTLCLPTESGALPPEFPSHIEQVALVGFSSSHVAVLQRALHSRGVGVYSFNDTSAAYHQLAATAPHTYQALLLDYRPNIDLPLFLKQLREELEIPEEELPVYVLHNLVNVELLKDKTEWAFEASVKPLTMKEFGLLLACKNGHKAEEKPKKTLSVPVLSTYAFCVLLVDDNSVNRVLAHSLLKLLLPNAEIVEAKNGKQALQKFAAHSPDLVLLDLQMPLMSGYEVATHIRQQYKDAHTPLVALTAGVLNDEVPRTRAAGMNAYLSKPLAVQELEKTLRVWLPLKEHLTASLRFHQQDFLRKFIGNTTNAQEIIDMLLDGHLAILVEQLSKAVRHTQHEGSIRKQAHLLRGTALTASLGQLALLAETLERLTPFDTRLSLLLLERLEEEAQRVVCALQQSHLLQVQK